jgi:hypothetical protein
VAPATRSRSRFAEAELRNALVSGPGHVRP